LYQNIYGCLDIFTDKDTTLPGPLVEVCFSGSSNFY